MSHNPSPQYYRALVAAMLLGRNPRIYDGVSRDTGAARDWPRKSVVRVGEIAQRQLNEQRSSIEQLSSRAQILLTTVLALAAVALGSLPALWSIPTDCLGAVRSLVIEAFAVISLLTILSALLGAGAVLGARRSFQAVSAVVIVRKWHTYSERRVALELIECVPHGERTLNAFVTVFGTTVRLTLVGAALLGVTWLLHFGWPAT